MTPPTHSDYGASALNESKYRSLSHTTLMRFRTSATNGTGELSFSQFHPVNNLITGFQHTGKFNAGYLR